MATEIDEPLTPAGRLFLQPKTTQIVHCLLGSTNPINVNRDDVRSAISNSVMINHPRFTSLMVVDRHGRQHWRRTKVNIDDHIIIHEHRLSDDGDDEDAVNDYLADLCVSTPLSTEKPLWEVHLLKAHNCVVLRVHHALGDGISLMSLLLTCCRKVDDPEKIPTINSMGTRSPSSGISGGRRWGIGELWRVVKMVWLTLVYVLEFSLRGLWMSDRKTALSGGVGVELWPRKLATARFRLDDMKTVKKAGVDATINDVLFAIISAGFSKYLDMHTPNNLKEGQQITGLAMFNLRPQPGLQELSELMARKSRTRWGNKFGMILLPVYYHKGSSGDPLQYLKRAKKMIDRKKLSLEAYFSYKIGYTLMKLLGAKFASWLNYRIVCNTTFTISNMMGPTEEITLAGEKIDYMRTTSTCLSHAITMHMLSYAGMAEMQILVAKDIIPDPKVLAKCLEDALLDMKAAAEAAIKTSTNPRRDPASMKAPTEPATKPQETQRGK